MQKIIIMEFNRTLFDIGSKCLFADAVSVMERARASGFEVIIITKRLGFSQFTFNNSGLKSLVSEIRVVENKSLELFEEVVNRRDVDRENSFVIGDRMKEDIRFGNLQGFSTILVRRGWFARETPSSAVDVPDYTVSTLGEVLPLLA